MSDHLCTAPLCHECPNLFDPLSARIVENARAVGIELRPTPETEGFKRSVTHTTPKGHYLTLQAKGAQIIAVDDYRRASNTYEELLPGYRLTRIAAKKAIDEDGAVINAMRGRFVSIEYLPVG